MMKKPLYVFYLSSAHFLGFGLFKPNPPLGGGAGLPHHLLAPSSAYIPKPRPYYQEVEPLLLHLPSSHKSLAYKPPSKLEAGGQTHQKKKGSNVLYGIMKQIFG